MLYLDGRNAKGAEFIVNIEQVWNGETFMT